MLSGLCKKLWSLSRGHNDSHYFLSIQQNHLVLQSSWNAPWKPCSSSCGRQWTGAIIFSLIHTFRGFTCIPLISCILQNEHYSCHTYVSQNQLKIPNEQRRSGELRRTELRSEKRRHNRGLGCKNSFACLIYIAACLYHSSLVLPLKETGFPFSHLWCLHWL